MVYHHMDDSFQDATNEEEEEDFLRAPLDDDDLDDVFGL